MHELKGCAAFQLKKYEEALDDLLRSSILYAKDGNESSRVNLYLFATFKALKASNSENFPDWQYKNKMAECYRKMSVADQNILKTFKF